MNKEKRQSCRLTRTQNYLALYCGTKRRFVRVNKRPYSSTCEICGLLKNSGNMLHYHHWDDARPWMGVWVCSSCHQLAEAIDRGSYRQNECADRYRVLKMRISGVL